MKDEDRRLFQSLLRSQPGFLEIVSWDDGPNPPDIIAIDSLNRRLGLELTEWLDTDQTTLSISTQEDQTRWLEAINHGPRPAFRNISRVVISFKTDSRFQTRLAEHFRNEFFSLLTHIDDRWRSEIEASPQRLWGNFESYPTLRRRVSMLWFPDLAGGERPDQSWWVSGEGKGGAYDPYSATNALLWRIREKVCKSAYPALKGELKLSELILLLHYGIRGIMHNTPYHGINRELDDTLVEARTLLKENPGPFDRAFLYLAVNEGNLLQLYPS